MNRALVLLALLLVLVGCGRAREEEPDPPALPEMVEIFYFFEELCASCIDEEAFFDLFREQAGDVADMHPHRLVPVNVARTTGRNFFEEQMQTFGHSPQDTSFPLMMVGSRLYQGDENIARNIREAFLVAGEDIFVNQYVFNPLNAPIPLNERHRVNPAHNTIVYFYRIVCPDCIYVEPFINDLPETKPVNGDDIPIDIIRINTRSGNNGALIRAFFEFFDVPDTDQFVPIIFLRDTHITGSEQIKAELHGLLAQGAGIGFEFPPE